MTSREITVLAVRVFAIYILVKVALHIPGIVKQLASIMKNVPENTTAHFWVIGAVTISVLAAFAVGIMLWRFSGKILADSGGAELTGSIRDLEPIILSALGIFLTVQGLVRLAHTGTSVYVMRDMFESSFRYGTIARLIGYVFQVAVGLSLTIKSSGWALILRKFRNAGLEK